METEKNRMRKGYVVDTLTPVDTRKIFKGGRRK